MCSEYGTEKIIDVNILGLNSVYFPNYCLIIKTSISLKVRSTGFCPFAAVKKKKQVLTKYVRKNISTKYYVYNSSVIP